LSPLISVIAALCAALILGISSVAEQRGTKRVKPRQALSPRLLLDLARQSLWVSGIAATVIGFALQVVALRFGPLALVEPILVLDLVFAVLISAYLQRRRDAIIFAGVAACAIGIAGFLLIGQPSGGRPTVGFHVLLPLAAGLVVALAGCLVVARRSKTAQPLALALACGICYGVSAFLVKLVVSDVSGGLPHLFTHWPIYALAVVGPLGFLLNQNAFQQGELIAPVLAIITACDPLISIALAYFWLNETLASSPLAVAGQIVSLLIMITGITVVAHHAPQVRRSGKG
jgi:drug/metabolite transporter (DMT)-like permease